MNIEIVEATESDIAEISRLYLESLQKEYNSIIPHSVIDSFGEKDIEQDCGEWATNGEKFAFAYIALIDKVVVGYISAGSNTNEPFEYDAEIRNIIVEKDFQNRGIGKKLILKAIKKLEDSGYSSVVIFSISKSKANGFYRKLRGKVINQIIQDDGGEKVGIDVFGWEIKELKEIILSKINNIY